MSLHAPGWVYRFLTGIVVCVVVAIYQAYQVVMSTISLWDKIGILAIQFVCIGGLIWGFLYYYARYKGLPTKLNNRLVYVAIIPPLIVLGLISAYMIIPAFLNSISFSQNLLPSGIAKIIAFIAIAVIGIAGIFYPRN